MTTTPDDESAPDASSTPNVPTPLVLLHGAGQAPMAWQDVVTALYSSRPLSSPWISGMRPGTTGSFSLEQAALDLDRDLMLEGRQAVDVAGLSIGAMVATRLAAEVPSRVRRLVLIGGQVRPPKAALSMQVRLMKLMPAGKLAGSNVSKERMIELMTALRDADLTECLPRIQAPTLVLCGSRDRANLPAARQLAAGIPGATLRIIEGAGHEVNVQQGRELAGILAEFLDG